MRFFSEKFIRNWFEKKSGGKNEMFQYKADISDCKRIIVFLPIEQDNLFVMLPFVKALSEKRSTNDFLIFTDESNRHILRALNLENVSLFCKASTMLYGEADFSELEKKLQEQKWDLCIFLPENAPLPYLYMARATRANYRLGVKKEFPYLNITLQSSPFDENIYTIRKLFYKTFKIDSKKAEENAILITQKNEKQKTDMELKTSNTILLNLESPINGEPLNEDEIRTIFKVFQGHYRLLAIAATAECLESYSKVMEELDMRSNHIHLHSESIFSVLRQYPAIITLNSLHFNLFLNLSNIKIILLENKDTEVPNNQHMLKFNRDGNFYSLSDLAIDFLKINKHKEPSKIEPSKTEPIKTVQGTEPGKKKSK